MNIWERSWTLNFGRPPIYLGRNRTTRFKLKKKGVKGGSYFALKFKRREMCAEWNDCWLVARGTAHFKLAGDPLPEFDPYDQEVVDLYEAVIDAALKKTTTSTRRLEGELDNGLSRKMVLLFLARDAVLVENESGETELEDLVIVKTVKRFPWSDQEFVDPLLAFDGDPIEDGTAHGNPK
jgi:hypothetical protein